MKKEFSYRNISLCLWTLWILFIRFQLSIAACPGTFGETSYNPSYGNSDPPSTDTYLLYGNDDELTCCGYITEFKSKVGSTGTITYQIWAETATANFYQLVSEVTHTVTDASVDQSTVLTSANYIPISPGYRVGWRSADSVMIKYRNSPVNTAYYSSLGDLSTGHIQDWSSPDNTDSSILFAFGMEIAASSSTAPIITRPTGESVSILDSAAVSSLVYTVIWTDPDTADIPNLVVTMATNTYFQFDDISGQVTVKTSLAAAPTNGITLTFTVRDTCDLTDSDTLTINVVNVAPSINNLPSDTELSEDTTAETLLHTIDVTDTIDTVTCSLVSTTPSGSLFHVSVISGGTDYGIYSIANPNFDYDTNFNHVIRVRCSDGDADVEADFTLYLTRNEPPAFTNLPASATVSATAPVGTTVFTASATDSEGDSLTYRITCDTSSCPFKIYNSGVIELDTEISTSTTVGYDVSVYVSDGTEVGPKVLSMKVSDINELPIITNLVTGTAIPISENTAPGTSIFDVECNDNNVPTSQTLTFSMSSVTPSASTYFTIDSSSGLISTGSTITDYEALSTASTLSFIFTVACDDGVASSTVSLTLNVINVNEAPSFGQPSYSLTSTEGVAGTVLGIPTFVVTDPDTTDTKMYTQDCGSDTAYFLLASNDGQVSFLSNYDLDSGSRSSTVICTVTVTDSGGLTGTTSLSLYIDNINDNIPIFIPGNYNFFASVTESTGTSVGMVTATDADIGTNGDLTFNLDQTSLGGEYFEVTSGGIILVASALTSFSVNDILTFNVIATDGGGIDSSAVITMVITSSTTVATETASDDSYKSFFDDTRSVAWFVACLLLLATIIVTLTWLTLAGHIAFPKKNSNGMKKTNTKRSSRVRRRPPSPPTPLPSPLPRRLRPSIVHTQRVPEPSPRTGYTTQSGNQPPNEFVFRRHDGVELDSGI